MPRYFFDVTINGARDNDGDGVLLADPDTAMTEAQRVAGALAAEPNGPDKAVTIEIRSEDGAYFCEVELHVVVRKLD
jgi:hypothetical protein